MAGLRKVIEETQVQGCPFDMQAALLASLARGMPGSDLRKSVKQTERKERFNLRLKSFSQGFDQKLLGAKWREHSDCLIVCFERRASVSLLAVIHRGPEGFRSTCLHRYEENRSQGCT